MARPTDKDKEYDAKKLLESLGYNIEHESYYTCDCCGKSRALKQSHYYQTNNPLYVGCKVSYDAPDKDGGTVRMNHSILPFCKTCIEKMYNDFMIDTFKDEKLSMWKLTQELRLVWNEAHWEMARDSSSTSWKIYVGKLSGLPQMASLTIKDSEPYIGQIVEMEDEFEVKSKKINKSDRLELIKFWGNLSTDDLAFLSEQYQDWETRYTIDTKSMELLVSEICHKQLAIKQLREAGQSTSKELKDLQDLMNSSALKPIQESAAMGNDANTLGVWIKKIENEEPIADVLEEYRDVDGIGKMIRIFFLGHFNKMLGIKNELSEEYEREMAEYTVRLEESDE